MSDTIYELEKLITERNTSKIKNEGEYVHAAVMMILKKSGEGYSLLFIKRPERERDPFSGHMAFPGGSMESGDRGTLDTAIRETHEEVGIDINSSARVLGSLDDVNPNNPRAKNYLVTPYLSVLKRDVIITPDDYEVEEVVWVPVSHLADKKNIEIRMRERGGKMVEDYAYHYEQYIIWGMTGRILRKFFSFSAHLF